MNLLTLLQSDFRALSVESKKKFTPIKEAADRAIVKLRSLDLNSLDVSELSKSEDVIRPILLSLEVPKSPLQIKGGSYFKILGISIPCLQKLLSNNAIDTKHLPTIVKRLSTLINNDIQLFNASKINKHAADLLPDDLCVKILQAITTLITGTPGTSVFGTTLSGAISIAFKLHARGGPSVRATASATLPMVISMLFDRAQADLGKTPETNATKDAYSIMCDICALTNKDPATFLDLERLHSTFGLELIELIVSSHEKLFVENPKFKVLLPDKVCPTLIKYFRKVDEFPYCIRVVRIINVLIIKYLKVLPKELEVLLIRITKLLDQSTSTDWQQIVLLEILKNLFSMPDLVSTIYYNYDASHIIKENARKRRKETIEMTSPKQELCTTPVLDEDSKKEEDSDDVVEEIKMDDDEEDKVKTYGDDDDKEDEEEGDDDDDDDEEEEENDDGEANEEDIGENDAIDLEDERIPEEQSKKFEIYTVLIELVGKLIQAKFIPGSFIMEDAIPNSRIRVIEHLSQADPPTTKPFYKVTLALNCILAASGTLFHIARNPPEFVSDKNHFITMIAESSWTSFLSGLSQILELTEEEEVIQMVLKAYENIIYVLGTFNLDVPRNAFLNSLCKFATQFSFMNRNSQQQQGQQQGQEQNHESLFKTIESIKILLNIAHCMGNSLASGWSIIIPHLEKIDVCLRRLGKDSNDSDIEIATIALESFFESTVQNNDKSLNEMLKCLVSLSGKRLSETDTFALKSGKTTCYFFNKVMDTVRYNVTRVNKIWKSYSAQMRVALTHPSPVINSYAVNSFTDIVLASLVPELSFLETSKERCPVCKEPLASKREDLVGMQVHFVSLLDEMVSNAKTTDTRIMLYEAVNKIVQSAGGMLTDAWGNVLEILFKAVRIGDKQATLTAFQTVKLIDSDYLQKLSAEDNEYISKFITVVSSYVLQQDHTNMSLSSIEMIWSIGSFISKLSNDESQTVHNEVLWEILFNEEKSHCTEERSEVRYSAICTFFRILNTHGSTFNEGTWNTCLWDILFPIADFIKAQATSRKGEVTPKAQDGSARPAAKNTSAAVASALKESVHKNWCKSVVDFLGEMSRLFKLSIEQLSKLKRFDEAWDKVCNYAKECAEEITEYEAGECATCSMVLLLTCAAETNLERKEWEKGLETLISVINVVTKRPPSRTLPSILQNTVTAMDKITSGKYVTPEDVIRIADMVAKLSLLEIDDYCDECGMTSLQREVFNYLGKVPQVGETYTEEVAEKLVIMYSQLPFAAASLENANIPKLEERRRLTVFRVGCVGATACANLYSAESTSRTVRAKALLATAKNLGRALMCRYCTLGSQPLKQGAYDLWKSVLSAFNTIIAIGTAAGKKDGLPEGLDQEMLKESWTSILDSSREFLLPPRENVFAKSTNDSAIPDSLLGPSITVTRASTAGSSLEIDQLDVTLVEVLVDSAIKNGEGYDAVGEKLLALLIDGAKVASRGREQLCKGCYHGMFELASLDSSRKDLIELAAPKVVEQAIQVITQFVTETKMSGSAPARRSRLIEMLCVLRESRDLRTTLPNLPPLAGSNTRGHLLLLYPLLCECVTTPEQEIKNDLKDLMTLVGTEFLAMKPMTIKN